MFSCVLGSLCAFLSLFPFSDTPPTEIYTLSLHDALPISAISPFAGAGTGAGDEIRDEGAVGRGSKPKAGLTGLTVSNLQIPDFGQPWERDYEKPGRIASALDIMLEGPVGGAAFNNGLGRPNIGG